MPETKARRTHGNRLVSNVWGGKKRARTRGTWGAQAQEDRKPVDANKRAFCGNRGEKWYENMIEKITTGKQSKERVSAENGGDRQE